MTTPIYCLLSGGPDSATLAYQLAETQDITCLFVNFGQPFLDSELLAARRLVADLGVRLEEVVVPGLRHAFIGLGEDGGPVIMRGIIEATYGIASAYARYHGSSDLYHANIAEDVDDIPGLDKFFPALQRAVNGLPDAQGFRIHSPYIAVRKAEVFRRASDLKVPLDITWSCLKSGEIHCGACRACRRRKEAFLGAGLDDPTSYAA